MTPADEARRDRSIRRLLAARESLQLEALYLGVRADVLREYGAVTAALESIDRALHELTVYRTESAGGGGS